MRILKNILIGILIVFLFFACAKKEEPSEIRIGGMFALTGPTHESSIPYADGIRNCIDFINEQGGINGRKVRLIEMDYGYLIPRAKEVYKKLVEEDKVHVIMGWGTGDTEVLRPRIAKDKITFMSGSYSTKLGIIEEAPYNFLVGVTYSDQIRISLKFILEQWKGKPGKPRVAFIYNDTPFGRSPIADGRAYAASHGIEVVAEEIVALDAFEARDQLLRIKEKKADYAIIQETTWAASVILKDARKLGLKTRFIGLNWCVDEKLVALAGESAEGFFGVLPFLGTDENITGIWEISKYNARKGIEIEGYIHRYVQGWATVKVMMEGIKRAGDDISGPGIRKGLESLRNYSTGGITTPITFTPDNHKGTDQLKIGQVINGRWKTITDYLSAR
ncbi:MAG: ABC transporter substrate-binding protein [Proteobacteria bacterium]|nr:ABC transporter substrate-binding protein [Pseudomonadota bacterium]